MRLLSLRKIYHYEVTARLSRDAHYSAVTVSYITYRARGMPMPAAATGLLGDYRAPTMSAMRRFASEPGRSALILLRRLLPASFSLQGAWRFAAAAAHASFSPPSQLAAQCTTPRHESDFLMIIAASRQSRQDASTLIMRASGRMRASRAIYDFMPRARAKARSEQISARYDERH